jgi:opacity protein-like surface antigen
MKTIKFTVAALCAVAGVAATTHTYASEDNHFAGGYVVLSQEWKSANALVDGEKIKKSEAAPSIGLGYTFGVDKYATVGIKATFDTKKGEYGVGDTTALGETELKEKSHYSIAVEPGYAIRDDLLVFGILAYHKANTELIASTTTGTGSLHGFGYGLGAKYALPNHWFLMGEVQKVNYHSRLVGSTTVKPSSSVFALGLGYHF